MGMGSALEPACRDDAGHGVEGELSHADRLAKLGRLTAGIVHELNQPAAFVMVSHAAMLRSMRELERELDALPEAHRARQSLVELQRLVGDSLATMEQLRRLVKNVRDFGRPSSGAPEPVDVNEIVTSACALVRHELRSCKEVSMELGCVPEIETEPLKLMQVLVNVLVNAADAVAERDGGRRRVRVATHTSGDRVCIDVEDDGCGIPEAIREHVFEPFFSTKPGRGSGLGLWLSAGIVRSLGGVLEFQSQQGVGTRFSIALPVRRGPEH